MSDFQSQSNAFSVKLLEGDSAGTVVELEGRALPSAVSGRGTIFFESQQRIKTTYYAGNPVATQQLMGPVETNTVITGIWKDTFLGNGVAALLRDTFDGIARAGIAVEVTWGAGFLPDGTQTSKPYVRRGLIKRFKSGGERPQDVTWEMEFEWRGRDEAAQPPLQGAGQGDDEFSDLQQDLTDTQSAIDAFHSDPLIQLAGFNAQVETQFAAMNTTLDQSITTIAAANATLATTENLPNEVLERLRGTTTSLLGELKTFTDALLNLNVLNLEPRDSALASLSVLNLRFDTMESCDLSREKGSQVDAALAARQLPDVIAEEQPTPGTDFRDLARKYYGDPDLWWLIASFNGYGSSSSIPPLPAGTTDTPPRPIQIPRRTEGAQGSLAAVC